MDTANTNTGTRLFIRQKSNQNAQVEYCLNAMLKVTVGVIVQPIEKIKTTSSVMSIAVKNGM